MIRPFLALVVALTLPCAATAADKPKPKKLTIDLRALPRVASAPATIVFNVDIDGGEDGEGLYCLVADWEWNDGTRSTEEEECPPFEPGQTKVDRHYTASHEYREAAKPRITVTMRKGDHVLGTASIEIVIAPPKQPFAGSVRP